MMPISRRMLVGGALASSVGAGVWRWMGVEGNLMSPERWREWVKTWQWMEALATRRGWDVKSLRIDPPLSEASLVAMEMRHGLKVPPQLFDLLTRYSARVQFG